MKIEYYNRYTRQIEIEDIFGESFLKWAYGTALGRMSVNVLIKRAAFSYLYGAWMNQSWSRHYIYSFIENYGIDVAEFNQGVESYPSFNAFFSRKLKACVRPVEKSPTSLVFPADGRHLVVGNLSGRQQLWLKGMQWDLNSLLADASLAKLYNEGVMVISRLCPTDYHRFHFPCAGMPSAARKIKGAYYSVNPLALLHFPKTFWENKRQVTLLKNDQLGTVALIEVGATCVGSIRQAYVPGQLVSKGTEKGYFQFGGSTVLTLFEKNKVRLCDDLLEQSRLGRELYAKMGDLMGWAAEVQ